MENSRTENSRTELAAGDCVKTQSPAAKQILSYVARLRYSITLLDYVARLQYSVTLLGATPEKASPRYH